MKRRAASDMSDMVQAAPIFMLFVLSTLYIMRRRVRLGRRKATF